MPDGELKLNGETYNVTKEANGRVCVIKGTSSSPDPTVAALTEEGVSALTEENVSSLTKEDADKFTIKNITNLTKGVAQAIIDNKKLYNALSEDIKNIINEKAASINEDKKDNMKRMNILKKVDEI
jgi:hypothetical protein